MITLYHCAGARSFRPLWALVEAGVPYELKMLPFPPRAFQREYLQVNPLGTIPAFFHEDEPRMTESAAIAQFVADKYALGTLGVAPEEAGYGAYLNWLHFGEATLTFPQTLVLRYRRLEPPERRVPQAADDYAKWFLARARAISPILAEGYLAAGRFTAADISVAYAFLLAKDLGLYDELEPAARAYFEMVTDRDGFRAARSAETEAARAQGVGRAL